MLFSDNTMDQPSQALSISSTHPYNVVLFLKEDDDYHYSVPNKAATFLLLAMLVTTSLILVIRDARSLRASKNQGYMEDVRLMIKRIKK